MIRQSEGSARSARSAGLRYRFRVGTSPTWITSATGSIWVSNQSDGTVSRIDEKTAETVGSAVRIAAPADDAAAHVMSAAGESLWVVSATEHTLSRLNPKSETAPYGLAGRSVRPASDLA